MTRKIWSMCRLASTLLSVAGGHFNCCVADSGDGYTTLTITGDGAAKLMSRESGGHRFQRIPPTEKRGRVHSSTITVAVLEEPSETQLRIDTRDLEWRTCRSSGAGGQHVNKTESAVQVTHIPSGLQVRCESERSQRQNRATALSLLRARLLERQRTAVTIGRNNDRRQQIGSGERGDKIRTVRYQDCVVTDHTTGDKLTLTQYLRGEAFGG